jgi:hypothetical protein
MKSTAQYETFQILRTQRSLYLNGLASDQAIVADANETDLTEDGAATINARSFRNKGERNFFVHQYRRLARNIAQGNPFYL